MLVSDEWSRGMKVDEGYRCVVNHKRSSLYPIFAAKLDPTRLFNERFKILHNFLAVLYHLQSSSFLFG